MDYFDIAKGLAMFCVIAGHMGVRHVNAFVFSFHMPLFFLISGYFFKSDATKVWRNCKRLLTAYLWTVVAIAALSELFVLADVLFKGGDPFMLVENIGKWALAGLYGSGARVDCLGLHLPPIGAVWFLLALAWGVCFSLSASYKTLGNSSFLVLFSSLPVGSLLNIPGFPCLSRRACAPHSSCL